jgi:hypothetical protein
MALRYWYSDGTDTAWDAMNAGKCRNWWNAWNSGTNQPVANSQSTAIPANNIDGIVFAGSNAPTTGPASAINFVSVSDVGFSGWLTNGSITANIKIKTGGTLTWSGGFGGGTWCGDATAANVTLNISGGNFGDWMGMYQAKFGANVTLSAGTVYSATFSGPVTFAGYCYVGGDMGMGSSITVSGPVAVMDSAVIRGHLSTDAAGDLTFTESASIQGGSFYLSNGSVYWKSLGQFSPSSYGSGVYANALYAYKSVSITAMSGPMYPMGWDVTITINAQGQYGMGGVSGAINLSKLSKGGGVMNLNGW